MLSKLHFRCLLFLFLFAGSLLAVSGSKTKFLRFESEPESVYTELGKRVQLKCLAKPKKGSRIQWLINEEPVKIDEQAIFTDVDSLNIQLPERIDQNVGLYSFDELIKSEIQCRAEYKNQVLLSQPAKITVAFLADFPYADEIKVDVKESQIAVIPCRPPNSPPRVVTSFAFKNRLIESNDEKYHLMPSGNLQIFNVSTEDDGRYQCIAYNPYLKEKKNSTNYVTLHVERQFHGDTQANPDRFAIDKLNFLTTPKQRYSVIRGTDEQIFECVASSILPANISWHRVDGKPLPKNRAKTVGGNLVLANVQTIDEGGYACVATNGHKTITATSELEVKQSASIRSELESKQVQPGEQAEFKCSVAGNPIPKLVWFLNGLKLSDSNVEQLDMRIDRIGDDASRLVVRKANDQHSGIVQCFASNDILTVYSVAKLDVALSEPASAIGDGQSAGNKLNSNRTRNTRKNKNRNRSSDMAVLKIIRLSSDSVVVHWKTPKPARQPITFFRIQYKDTQQFNTTTAWITIEEDIPPEISSYAVTNLQSDKFYKFRIMAGYKNLATQDGKPSDQFFLAKNPINKRPASIPLIIEAKSDNSNSIEIYWDIKFELDDQVDGFLINYRPTQSAGIYNKITIDNNRTRAHVIENLVPSKQYDVKIQSFNSAGVSDFSKTESVRTVSAAGGPDDESIGSEEDETPDQEPSPNPPPDASSKEDDHHPVNQANNSVPVHGLNVDNNIGHPPAVENDADHSNKRTIVSTEPPNSHIDSTPSTADKPNESDNQKTKVDPLSTDSPLFYVIVGIIVLINLIILVYCYALMKRLISRSREKKAKGGDKFDLDDENFILKPAEEESLSRSFTKMNVFNEPLYSTNGVLSTNPHLTRKAIKSYNHNYATIGHSKSMFSKQDVYDSSLMNVRVNKFCDDSITSSLLAINKASGNQITKRDLPRMSTTISHNNLTRPTFASSTNPNPHTMHSNIHNKNLLLPETNMKAAISTLGRHRPTTRNFEDLYGTTTNNHFATINRSNSIARLNGTLERNKRKNRESRHDLFTVLNIKEENEPTTIVDLQQSPNLDFRNVKSVRYVNNNATLMNGMHGMNGMTSVNNLNDGIYNAAASSLAAVSLANHNHSNVEGIYNTTNRESIYSGGFANNLIASNLTGNLSANLNGNLNGTLNGNLNSSSNMNNTSLNSNLSQPSGGHIAGVNMNGSLNNYDHQLQNSPRSASIHQYPAPANLTPSQLTSNNTSNNGRPTMMQSSC